MSRPSRDDGWPREDTSEVADLPLDPDVDQAEDERHRAAPGRAGGPFAPPRRSRLPQVHWATVGMVAAGGFFGGLVRYAAGLAWPTPDGRFPWAIFGVNTVGAFILALVLVLALEVLPPSRWLRPVVGTGFCGALTTFSSVATGADQLVAHGHPAVAVGYVVTSVLAGLAAASLGIMVGRSVAANREKGRP